MTTQMSCGVGPPLQAGFALYMRGDGMTVVHQGKRVGFHRVPLRGRCYGLPREAEWMPDPPPPRPAGCLCGRIRTAYVREANADDEAERIVRIADTEPAPGVQS